MMLLICTLPEFTIFTETIMYLAPKFLHHHGFLLLLGITVVPIFFFFFGGGKGGGGGMETRCIMVSLKMVNGRIISLNIPLLNNKIATFCILPILNRMRGKF